MVDIQTISIVIASGSVVLAAIYYVLQLRHQSKMRQLDITLRVYSTITSKEWCEAWEKVRDRETLDYNSYKEKYGLVELNEVCATMEEVGVLLRKKFIDIDLADDLFIGSVKMVWEKVKPIVEDGRKLSNRPQALRNLEYFYNEVKKREQKLQQTGVKSD